MAWASLHMAKQGSSVLVVILFAVGALDLVLGTIIEVRHASGFASHEPTIWTWIFVGLAAALIAWPFHSVFTRPYVRIDEDVAHTSWGRSTITLPTSRFQQPNSGIPNATVSVGFSYRWLLHQRLGEAHVAIPQPAFTYIRARLGPFNSSPFRIHEVRS